MTEFSIGPGVAEAIAAAGDTARSDEQFVILREGDKVSQTFGSLGIYWWYEAENVVKRASYT